MTKLSYVRLFPFFLPLSMNIQAARDAKAVQVAWQKGYFHKTIAEDSYHFRVYSMGSSTNIRGLLAVHGGQFRYSFIAAAQSNDDEVDRLQQHTPRKAHFDLLPSYRPMYCPVAQ